MNIGFTGRNVEVTPALRDFAEEKLRKLERLLDGALDIHVVLAIEKHRHVAEIQVKARNAVFSGTQETGDLYASIGEVADKLERQALKHKEKLQSHSRESLRHSGTAADSKAQDAADEFQRPRILRGQSYRVKPLSAEDAALEMEAGGQEFLVFRDTESDRICVLHRQKDGNLLLVEAEV